MVPGKDKSMVLKMTEGKSLVNFGDISKPATVLIERISDAVGGYFKPYQIKRLAKAESEADLIKAESQINISELQRRAVNRFIAEESKKQENIEAITEEAIPKLKDNSKPEEVEEDWITNFFDKCRIVSDKEMQSLWATVLAGEANAPGSFSKRTVNFLGSLDRSDARLFTILCGFGWLVGDVIPLIYNVQDSIYNDMGINFNSLTHLDDIGLLSFNVISGYKRMEFPEHALIHYYGKPIIIKFPKKEKNELETGKVILSKIGQELASICGSTPVTDFQEYIIDHWVTKGLVLSSPFPRNQKI